MFDDMDSKALLSSEVFRNLLEVEKQAEINNKIKEQELEKSALDNFQEFQKKVCANPALKNEFKKIQDRLINDSEYRRGINQDFVQGVLLLNLED